MLEIFGVQGKSTREATWICKILKHFGFKCLRADSGGERHDYIYIIVFLVHLMIMRNGKAEVNNSTAFYMPFMDSKKIKRETLSIQHVFRNVVLTRRDRVVNVIYKNGANIVRRSCECKVDSLCE